MEIRYLQCLTRKMILRIIFFILLLYGGATATPTDDRCLTGDMTDVQSWVDGSGNIIAQDSRNYVNTLDVSQSNNPVTQIRQLISSPRRKGMQDIVYLNMARCRMRNVPQIFDIPDQSGRFVSETVEYMTLFGNDFQDFGRYNQEYQTRINATGAREVSFRENYGRTAEAVWPLGFRNVTFQRLRELDLRSCSIQTLDDHIFRGMPNLEALYMGGNNIFFISVRAFNFLRNLVHLDLSRNEVLVDKDDEACLFWEFSERHRFPENLVSLDLSYTKISRSTVQVLSKLGRNFQRLSLCHAGVRELGDNFFNGTSLRLIDVSGNNGILNNRETLHGVEDTLEVIYADEVSLTTVSFFRDFKKLKMIKAINNFVKTVDLTVSETLENLNILLLDYNRITTWSEEMFKPMRNLQFLSLKFNNINLIKPQMLQDISHVKYVGLSGNFFICSCHAKELYNIALANDFYHNYSQPFDFKAEENNTKYKYYHTGLEYYHGLISKRVNMNQKQKNPKSHNVIDQEITGDFVLYDYEESAYKCLVAEEGVTIPFCEENSCKTKKNMPYDKVINQSWNKLILILVIPLVLMVSLFLGFYFKRSLKYFYITVRNSAMLSMIDGKKIDEDTIFNYDVFVSYCNEDRPWVLDKLLPQLERECSVSVCLHERDFQVGLSILENIVSCMDRSRSIMLIISQRFLLSQWCQFEMHLAQHRLLETRREDLILVLLEDIPRRLRPNTLHYLMLSKTYVQWPQNPDDRPLFWRRLKKSLVSQRNRLTENVSLA